ncbi:MAG: fasciclin domain-containing protein, partial [Bacteroidaceae bacterium]|nr:fasciclin domain-containing protein [Bacteroidaceae bacterium]
MKNHFSKMGKALLNAALLSTVGFTSCADDKFHLKDYEDSKPSFLGQSIYHELQNRGEYSTVLRLIDDLEYAEVLSKTGSKTLFVANDEAYAKFFAEGGNPWGVRSYDDLSKNQKRVLLNNSMLNNAYVLEMLANTEGGGKNLCLRQGTSATASDSVTRWAVTELPATQSAADIDWFKHLRTKGDSVYMALDSTDPMMTHFLEGQMKEKNITTADIEKIMGNRAWVPADTTSFGFINDCRIIDGDVVCLNGYIHVLDKVLLAPGNMAEIIRSNGNTNYFSAMLDRFAAPYYNEQLTRQYKALNDIPADSIFEKRYISNRSQGGGKVYRRPDGLSFGEQQFLPFDPGWNQYAVSSSTVKEQDMAAMFVPSDEAMVNYFVKGGGTDLIKRYGILENTAENLLTNLYQIPLHLIQPLIQNWMKDSFNESVPSKYLTLVNDAQDQRFASYTSLEDYKAH